MANSNFNDFKATYLGLSACIALAISPHIIALGLGDLAEKSVIGEPLRATLAITGEEKFPLKTLSVRRINAAEAASMGIELLPFDLPVSFEVRQEEDRRWVVMSSQQAVTKPYMEFLLELSWPKGSVVREFIILPSTPTDTAPKVSEASRQSTDQVVPTQVAYQTEEPTKETEEPQIDQTTVTKPTGKLNQYRPIPVQPQVQQPVQTDTKRQNADDSTYTRFSSVPADYVIQPGDILSRVARDWGRSTGQSSARLTRKVTRWLIKNNPQIFENQKIDRLIVGQRLIFPTPDEMGVTVSPSREESVRLVSINQAVTPDKKVAALIPTQTSEAPKQTTESDTQQQKVTSEAAKSFSNTSSSNTSVGNDNDSESSKELVSFMGQRVNQLIASNNRHEERWLRLHKLPLHPAIEAYSQQYPEEALKLRETYEGILSDAFDQTLEMSVDTFASKETLQIANNRLPTRQTIKIQSEAVTSANTIDNTVAPLTNDIDPVGSSTQKGSSINNSTDLTPHFFGLSVTLLKNLGISLAGLLACLGVFGVFRKLRKGSTERTPDYDDSHHGDMNSSYVAKAAVELDTPEWHDPISSQVNQDVDEVEEQLNNFVNHFDKDFTAKENHNMPDSTPEEISSKRPLAEERDYVENESLKSLDTTSTQPASTPPTESLADELDLQLDVSLINQLISDDLDSDDTTSNTDTSSGSSISPMDLLDTHDFSNDLDQAPLITDTVEESASPSDIDLSLMGSDLGADSLPFGGDFLNMDDDMGGSDKVANLISDVELYIEIGQLDKARDLMKEMAEIDDDPRVTAAFEEFGTVLNFKCT